MTPMPPRLISSRMSNPGTVGAPPAHTGGPAGQGGPPPPGGGEEAGSAMSGRVLMTTGRTCGDNGSSTSIRHGRGRGRSYSGRLAGRASPGAKHGRQAGRYMGLDADYSGGMN